MGARLGTESTRASRIEERSYEQGFVAADSLDLPREREAGAGAGEELQLVSVVPASGAGRDGGAVPPRGVRVGEPLALAAALRDVPLTVRERGKVGGVNSHVYADTGQLAPQGGGHGVEAVGKGRLVLAQLDGEAVAAQQLGDAASSRRMRAHHARCCP